MEIKRTKLVKEKGLAKPFIGSNCKILDLNALSTNIIIVEFEGDETQEPSLEVNSKFSQSDWYKETISYLQNFSCSPTWDKSRARSIKLKVAKYCILGENLFWKEPRGILLNFLTEEETEGIIIEFHKGVCGGHHAWIATAYKILRVGYYWPSLFSYVHGLVRACV